MYNGHSAALVITRSDSDDNTIGSLTVKNGETVVLEKEPTDKLITSAGSNASSVKLLKSHSEIKKMKLIREEVETVEFITEGKGDKEDVHRRNFPSG